METYPDYDVKSLRNNLKRCDNNIQIFREAIQKEEDTKEELRRLIVLCEERDTKFQELLDAKD